MSPHRPVFDDIRDDRRNFTGPPAPPQIPKFTPKTEREAVQTMLLDGLAARIAAETSAFKEGA